MQRIHAKAIYNIVFFIQLNATLFLKVMETWKECQITHSVLFHTSYMYSILPLKNSIKLQHFYIRNTIKVL